MSRIRTIKPDFWSSEQVLSCSPLARLLFIGMWNFCDDNGIHPASYVRLKAEIFPSDDFTNESIKAWINELIVAQLVREYSVGDKSYWIVTGWKSHQRIDRPTYRHPLPPINERRAALLFEARPCLSNDDSSNDRRIANENLSIDHRVVDEVSLTEGNGVYRNGMEIHIPEVETSGFPIKSFEPIPTEVLRVFEHWQKILGHPRAKLGKDRIKAILKALKDGYTVEELMLAIEGCSKTPFNMGQNDSQTKYDNLELILSDASHIDRFIENATINITTANNSHNIMAGVL